MVIIHIAVLLWWLTLVHADYPGPGSCYYPSGDLSSDTYPCDEYAYTSLCCPLGWTCYSNLICAVTEPNTANATFPIGTSMRGTCTNPSWNGTACGTFCLLKADEPDGDSSGLLSPCGDNTFCCAADESSGACDCATGQGSFNLGTGSAQTVLGVTGTTMTATPYVTPSLFPSTLATTLIVTSIVVNTLVTIGTSVIDETSLVQTTQTSLVLQTSINTLLSTMTTTSVLTSTQVSTTSEMQTTSTLSFPFVTSIPVTSTSTTTSDPDSSSSIADGSMTSNPYSSTAGYPGLSSSAPYTSSSTSSAQSAMSTSAQNDTIPSPGLNPIKPPVTETTAFKAGIGAAGAVVALGLLGVAIWYWRQRRCKDRDPDGEQRPIAVQPMVVHPNTLMDPHPRYQEIPPVPNPYSTASTSTSGLGRYPEEVRPAALEQHFSVPDSNRPNPYAAERSTVHRRAPPAPPSYTSHDDPDSSRFHREPTLPTFDVTPPAPLAFEPRAIPGRAEPARRTSRRGANRPASMATLNEKRLYDVREDEPLMRPASAMDGRVPAWNPYSPYSMD